MRVVSTRGPRQGVRVVCLAGPAIPGVASVSADRLVFLDRGELARRRAWPGKQNIDVVCGSGPASKASSRLRGDLRMAKL